MIHISSEEIQAIVGYAAAGLFAFWKSWNMQKQNPPSHVPREPEPTLVQLEAQFQAWREDQLSMHEENKERQDTVLKQLSEHRSLLDRILLRLARIE